MPKRLNEPVNSSNSLLESVLISDSSLAIHPWHIAHVHVAKVIRIKERTATNTKMLIPQEQWKSSKGSG
ncbi:hypothetical protein PaeBR_14205 [Paenibacillus sp. BR2-3]|uniref:hypothetical protein n=1 Tax=Paenibacillus sp. BR2-3 TaxID=3048494 RepID=UPI003977DB10